MSKKDDEIIMEVDWQLIGVILLFMTITIIPAYFFMIRPYQDMVKMKAEIHDCRVLTGQECDYYCLRGKKECLAMPKVPEPNETEFESYMG